VTTLATLSFQVYPQIYYVLGATWTLLLSLLLFGLYRRDIEINTRSSLVRFADLSAVLVLKLRKVTASILESKTQIEIEEKTAKGMRAVLNIAHEYYSSVTGEYCTANVQL
jgi:hypothetical protein